jgi:phosphoribosylanthranilate isomerase
MVPRCTTGSFAGSARVRAAPIMTSVRVKICGITRPADAVSAEAAGADAIGLLFAPESPRFVTLEVAREVCEAVGPLLVRVGVFRDAPLEQVLDLAAELRLGAVQLHGSEDAEYVRRVRSQVPVIRAVSFTPGIAAADLRRSDAEAVLLDGLRPGSGSAFDWTAAAHLRGEPRLILAGGLHPGNVAAGVRALEPYGVDVSTGVESSPGIKDVKLIASFVAAARGVPAPAARRSGAG